MIWTLLNKCSFLYDLVRFLLFCYNKDQNLNKTTNSVFFKDQKSLISFSLTNKNSLFLQKITSKLSNMKKKFPKGSTVTAASQLVNNIKMLYLCVSGYVRTCLKIVNKFYMEYIYFFFFRFQNYIISFFTGIFSI